MDDGAQSMETAIEMCRIAHRDGITHLVATPHANNFSFENFEDAIANPKRNQTCRGKIRDAMSFFVSHKVAAP